MIEPNIPNVKLSQVERIIKAVKDHYKEMPERIDDIELSFEFVIGSLFPNVYKNVMDSITDAYTKGYIAGLNDRETEIVNED